MVYFSIIKTPPGSTDQYTIFKGIRNNMASSSQERFGERKYMARSVFDELNLLAGSATHRQPYNNK